MCVLAVICTVGFAKLWDFSESLTPDLYYKTTVRLPAPPPPPPDRSGEGPRFGELTHGPGRASTSIPGSWPCFRGADHSNIVADSPPLLHAFPPDGPPVRWSVSLGEGYAGAAVQNGKVYVLDYDAAKRRDALRCLSLDDGREIWRFSYPVKIKRNHGMSRTMPALAGPYCLTLGPMCHVSCLNAETGEPFWTLDLPEKYGTQVPQWYAGQCPLIVDFPNGETTRKVALIAPSGPEALVVALDCATGEEIWRTPNPFGWVMTHTSLMPMMLDGRQTFVYSGKGGVVGIDAADGKILWSNLEWSIGIATCPSPLVLPENRVFLCGGYEAPSVVLQISPQAGGTEPYQAKIVSKQRPSVFGSEQQTPLLFENHIFGLRQRDRKFVCLDLDGKVVWHSGSKADFGSRGAGPYMIAGDLFLILSDEGVLTIANASPAEFQPLGSHEIFPDGVDAWGPMSFVDGRLILRDLTRMVCIDLRKGAE